MLIALGIFVYWVIGVACCVYVRSDGIDVKISHLLIFSILFWVIGPFLLLVQLATDFSKKCNDRVIFKKRGN